MLCEQGAVLKFVERLDAFVHFRVLPRDDLRRLLTRADVSNRASYQRWVISQCLLAAPASVPGKLEEEALAGERDRPLTVTLYDACVELNPDLDIRRVVVPALRPRGEKTVASCPKPARRRRPAVRELEAGLRRRVVGQENAIRRVARAVARAWTGLRDPDRPVGVFIFSGPTGVGKTEMAKALAEVLDELDGGPRLDKSPLARIDCSEYALPHEYAKLIGAPPGYVGHEQGGGLTSVMNESNARVVLFDEIEKADEKVHNLLLQIMDEGFVTDARGVRVDFTESLILMTSNVGAAEIDALGRRVGFSGNRGEGASPAACERAVTEALRRKFRPEFLNRVDEAVFFRPLERRDALAVVDKFLHRFRLRARGRGLKVELSETVRRRVVDKGFSKEHGAREIRRTAQRLVEAPLAEALLDGSVPRRGRVRGEWRNGRTVFRAVPRKRSHKTTAAG